MPTSLAEAWDRLRGLASVDGQAFLVGGAVRDALLGRALHEVDIVVSGDLDAFAARAARALDTHPVVIGRDHPIVRLPLTDAHVDLAPMAPSLKADLAARDFTVNTLAIPLAAIPASGPAGIDPRLVIDHHAGKQDLESRTIRMTSPQVFDADPLRTMRAIRLACELDFEIAPATRDAVRHAAPGLARVAPDRVGAELLRIFATPRAAHGVRLLDECGLNEICFPALVAGRGVEQRPAHHLDVYTHALVTADWMDLLLADRAEGMSDNERSVWAMTWRDEPWPETRWGPLRAHLLEHAVALRLATLLHDLGKPQTRTEDPDGRTRFFGHAEVGAALAADLLRGWRLPTVLIERVALLIAQHLRPGQVASPGTGPTPRAFYRFHQALGDATPDVCFLFLADSLGTAGASMLLPRWRAYVRHVRTIACWEPAPEAARIRRLVDGNAVMGATHLAPGPEIGRLLAAIDEAASAGEITTPDAALELARHLSGRT